MKLSGIRNNYFPLLDVEKPTDASVVTVQDVLQHNAPVLVRQNEPRGGRWQAILELIGDVVFCLAPLQFVALAVSARIIDGSASDSALLVSQWALASGTLFPIVFAGVAGRSLRLIARYKLENGTKLKVLEQLFGSTSVFTSFWTQYILMKFSFLGFGLAVLWLMSPLGGMTASRVLFEGPGVNSINRTLATINLMNQTSLFSQNRGSSTVDTTQENGWALANLLFQASFLSTLVSTSTRRDLWTNLRIRINETDSEIDNYYASLIGHPISGIVAESASSSQRWRDFSLEAFYYNVSCSNPYNLDAQSDWVNALNLSVDASRPANEYNQTSIWLSEDDPPKFLSFRVGPRVDDRVGLESDHQGEWNIGHRSFTWLSKAYAADYDTTNLNTSYGYKNVTVAQCSLTPRHVDVKFQCVDNVCDVLSSSLIPKPQTLNSSDFNQARYWAGDLIVDNVAWVQFWNNLQSRQTQVSDYFDHSTFVENYISGQTDNPFNPESFVDLSQVPVEQFNSRLQLIINTYYMAALAPNILRGQIADINPQAILNGSLKFYDGELNVAFTEVIASERSLVWICHLPAFSIVISISLFLCALGCYGTYLKYQCRGPEVLGFIATSIRENPNTPLVLEDSDIHTAELVRRNRDMYLRLEDVTDGQARGHVAISSLHRRSIKAAKIEDPLREYI